MRTQPNKLLHNLKQIIPRLAKEQIILNAMNEGLDEFLEGVKMALDPLYTFGVKQVPPSRKRSTGPQGCPDRSKILQKN